MTRLLRSSRVLQLVNPEGSPINSRQDAQIRRMLVTDFLSLTILLYFFYFLAARASFCALTCGDDAMIAGAPCSVLRVSDPKLSPVSTTI